jgi:hypothetical protein
MKTCKYGCGGKMKEGGKVATIKKMKAGETSSKPCPPGLCKNWNPEHTSYACDPCPSVQAARGIIGGIASAAVNAITSKMGKKREANKEVKGMVKNIVKKAKSTKVMQKGGPAKMQMGGYAKPQMGGDNTKMGIYGVPNAGRTDALGFKKGGSTTSRAVAPGCRGGMVKDASGKCVMERKFKAGGTVNKKFAALAPPYNKATFADRIAGAKKKAGKK